MERCIVCGSEETTPYFEGDDRVFRCLSCGTAVLAERLRIADSDAYYASSQSYSSNASDKKKVAVMIDAANEVLDILGRYIHPPGKKFFDIGANHGILVEEAAKRGYVASGSEKNRTLVEGAKSRGLRVTGEDFQTCLDREKFDVITLVHVLEHLPNPRKVIKDISAALTPNGLFYVEVPNIESFLAKHHRLAWKYFSREHLFYSSPRTLTDLLKSASFEVLLLKSRNHFIGEMSLREMLHYIFGTRITRDRFFMKRLPNDTSEAQEIRRGPVFRLLKRAVAALIRALHREDLILAVARKK